MKKEMNKLYRACKEGNIEDVKRFVSDKVDYAMQIACEYGHLEVVKYLKDNGAGIGDVIYWASECGHLEVVKYFKSIGASDNRALSRASEYGHLEVVKYLKSIGDDILYQNNKAVRLASKNGHLEVVKYLKDNGADISAENNCPIRWASLNGHLEVVKYLKDNGVDISAENDDPIRLASKYEHLDVVEYLISQGANMDKLTPEHKIYFLQKRAYTKWRKIHLRKWVRHVLIPWYYSPENKGGLQNKKELENLLPVAPQPRVSKIN